MATLKLKSPVASGKFKVIYPITETYNYKLMDDKVLVQHHIKTMFFLPLDRKDVIIID